MPACFICSSQVNESTSPLDVERPATKSCLIRASLARCSETKGHSRYWMPSRSSMLPACEGQRHGRAPCTRPGAPPTTPQLAACLAGQAACHVRMKDDFRNSNMQGTCKSHCRRLADMLHNQWLWLVLWHCGCVWLQYSLHFPLSFIFAFTCHVRNHRCCLESQASKSGDTQLGTCCVISASAVNLLISYCNVVKCHCIV